MIWDKELRYKKMIFLSSVLAAIVPLIIIGIYSYNTLITEVKKNINLSNEIAILQLQADVEEIMQDVEKYYLEIIDSEPIKWISENEINYSDYTQIREVQELLKGANYFNNYITEYSFINFNTGWVLGNNGMYQISEASNREEIEGLFNSNGQVFWLNNNDKKQNNFYERKRINTSYLSLVLKLPINGYEMNSMIIINLNRENMEKLIQNRLGVGEITVLDAFGKLIYTDDLNIGRYFETEWKLSKELAIDKIQLDNKEKYIVQLVRSNWEEWSYIASYNMNDVRKTASKILCTTVVLMGGLSLFIFTSSLWKTKYIYNPIYQLMGRINKVTKREMGEDDKIEDEFNYINEGINLLLDRNKSLEFNIDIQKKKLTELFVYHLINDEITEENILKNTKNLNIVSTKYMSIISLVFHGNKKEEIAAEQVVYNRIIDNMPQDINEKVIMDPIVHNGILLLVVGNETKEILEADIIYIIEILLKFIAEQYGYMVRGGIGRTFNTLFQFKQAYNESIEALRNNQQEAIMFYEDVCVYTKENKNFKIEESRLIKEALEECDKEKAFEEVDKFIQNIISSKLVFNERYFYLYRYMIKVVDIAVDIGAPINHIFEESKEISLFIFNQIYDVDRLRDFYKHEIISPIIDLLSEIRKSNEEIAIVKIINLVDETEGDITLTECVDQLGYHPTYIWKVLKNKMNMTFTEYTSIKRIELAKEMLINTEMLISEIAIRLNYTNTQNFIRFFSKHEGVTPGRYRKDYRKDII